jgi:hypothetical protein
LHRIVGSIPVNRFAFLQRERDAFLKKQARKVSVLRLSEFGYLIIVTGRYLQ